MQNSRNFYFWYLILNNRKNLKNNGISKLSDFYNSTGEKQKIIQSNNSITFLFYFTVSSQNSCTSKKTYHLIKTIDGIFKNFGGKYFLLFSDEEISIDDFQIHIFSLFSPYFDLIVLLNWMLFLQCLNHKNRFSYFVFSCSKWNIRGSYKHQKNFFLFWMAVIAWVHLWE